MRIISIHIAMCIFLRMLSLYFYMLMYILCMEIKCMCFIDLIPLYVYIHYIYR